jgi:ABC-2 type transport system ATP-binding protein
VTVPAPGAAAQLATVIGRLQDASIGVEEIGLRRPSLDEVFGVLTGVGGGAGDRTASVTAGRLPARRAS